MKRMENPITKWTNFLRRWIQIEFRPGLTGTDFAPAFFFRRASFGQVFLNGFSTVFLMQTVFRKLKISLAYLEKRDT